MGIGPYTKHLDRYLIVIGLILLPLIVCGQQLRYNEWFASHYDYFIRYPYLLEAFRDIFREGTLYPRWIPTLFGGYGYPTFLLYQPGYWFFSLPFFLFTDSPVWAAKLSNLASLLLMVAGIYRIIRFYGTPRWSALAGVALLVFYHHIFTQAASRELGFSMRLGHIFAVWGMAFFLEMTRAIEAKRPLLREWACFAAASTAVLYTHPFVAVFYAMIMTALLAGYAWAAPRQDRAMLIAGWFSGLLLALVLSAPYWYTTLRLSGQVEFGALIRGIMTPQWQLENQRYAVLYFTGGLGDDDWDNTKWVFLALLTAHAFSMRKSRLFLPLVLLYFFTLFIVNPASAFIWDHVKPLQYLQRPQRFVVLRDMIDIFIVAHLANRYLHRQSWGRLAAAGTICACLGLFTPLADVTAYTDVMLDTPAGSPHRVNYEDTKDALLREKFMSFQREDDELLPKTVVQKRLINRYKRDIPLIQAGGRFCFEGVDIRVPASESMTGVSGTVTLTAESQLPASILINQFYFPGWQVSVNGRDIPFGGRESGIALDYDANGRMRLVFAEPGQYDIEATYAGPPGWQARNAAVILLALATIVVFLRYHRQWRRPLLRLAGPAA